MLKLIKSFVTIACGSEFVLAAPLAKRLEQSIRVTILLLAAFPRHQYDFRLLIYTFIAVSGAIIELMQGCYHA